MTTTETTTKERSPFPMPTAQPRSKPQKPPPLTPPSLSLSPAERDYLLDLARQATTPEQLDEIETLLNLPRSNDGAPPIPQRSKRPQSNAPLSKYERKRQREAQRQRKQSAAARELANLIPPVSDPALRQRCLDSLRTFAETCFKERFSKPWSQDHLNVIADIERVVIEGGLFGVAMPRGSGKTALLEVAVLWSILRGEHKFAVLLGATAKAAEELLESIKKELDENDVLADLWPEICVPIRALEGINQRRVLYNGRRIKMKITSTTIVLPDLPTNPASASVLKVAGILGRIRGMKHRLPGGRIVRPKIALLDDPQTDESARRPKDVDRREKNIRKAVLGLAGPGERMSVFCACTFIQKDDLSDRLFNKTRNPRWETRKTKLINAWPTDRDRWAEYAEIRRYKGQKAATAYYSANQPAMDKGGEAAWKERFEEGQLTAIQFGEDLRIDDPVLCAAEYQNDPEDESADDHNAPTKVTAEEITRRQNGHAQGVIPLGCEYLAAGIDIQKRLLYYEVSAAEADPTIASVDYGTFPEQRRSYFTLENVTTTIQTKFPKIDAEAQLYNALEALIADLVGRVYKREDGSEVKIRKIVLDARYMSDVVFRFCRQSPHKDILLPAFGSKSIKRRQSKPPNGTKQGVDYYIPPLGKRLVRYAVVDSNAWITRTVNGWATPMGARGAWTVYKAPPEKHRNFADHQCAEYSSEMIDRETGETIRTWHEKPDHPDNHWLDAKKLAALGCFELGCRPPHEPSAQRPGKRRRYSAEELKALKEGRKV